MWVWKLMADKAGVETVSQTMKNLRQIWVVANSVVNCMQMWHHVVSRLELLPLLCAAAVC